MKKIQNIRFNWALSIGLAFLSFLVVGVSFEALSKLIMSNTDVLARLMSDFTTMAVVQSDGDQIYIFSTKPNSSSLPLQGKRTGEKFYYSILRGSNKSFIKETEPFVTVSGADQRIVAFDRGVYRIYKGDAWDNITSSKIGEIPKGVVAKRSLFVMSVIDNMLYLARINEVEASFIPFPLEFARDQKEPVFQLIELVGHNDLLYLMS